MNKHRYSLLDLYAGCGGLSLGLKAAGMTVTWANEIWGPAATTYRAVHPDVPLVSIRSEDVLSEMLAKDSKLPRSGEIDIVIGGPPCQGFSGWNRYRHAFDPRNSQVEIFAQIVIHLRPAVALMENVTGILSIDNGRAIKSLLAGFKENGYNCVLRVVQAGCYGVPQNRWRVFLFATRIKNATPRLIDPLHSFPRTVVFNATQFRECVVRPTPPEADTLGLSLQYLSVSDAISDLPAIENGEGKNRTLCTSPRSAFQKFLAANGDPLADHDCIKLGRLNMERVRALPPNSGQSWVDLPDKLKPRNLAKGGGRSYDNRFGRLCWDGIFNTIVTKPDPYWGRYLHPEQDRVLSVRECARAQGFPDSVAFSGALRERYTQIGNAVPPPLGRALGWSIRTCLGDRAVLTEMQEYRNAFKARAPS